VCKERRFVVSTFTEDYSDDNIKKNEMGEACNTHVEEEGGFDGKTLKKERLKDLIVDGMILKLYH
jgi:hypothetical protein